MWIPLVFPSPAFLESLAREQLTAALPGSAVSIDELRLISSGWRLVPDIHIRLLSVSLPRGGALRFHRISARPDLFFLLAGEIRFSRISAGLTKISRGPGPKEIPGAKPAASGENDVPFLDFLPPPPVLKSALKKKLPDRIHLPEVLLVSRAQPLKLALDFRFHHTLPGTGATVRIRVHPLKTAAAQTAGMRPDAHIRIRLHLPRHAGSGTDAVPSLSGTAQWRDVYLPDLHTPFPEANFLSGMDTALEGRLSFQLYENRAWKIPDFHIDCESGTFSFPGFFPAPLAVTGGAVSGSISGKPDAPPDSVWITEFKMGFGDGMRLEGRGHWLGIIDKPSAFHELDMAARLTDISIPSVFSYWPPAHGAEAREWLTKNLLAGRARQGNIRIHLTREDLAAATPLAEILEARLRFSGLSLRYFPGMSRIEDGAGTAVFSGSDIHIRADHARSRGTTARGAVDITGLASGLPEIRISGTAMGPVDDIRRAVDELTGNTAVSVHFDRRPAHTRLSFAFPLWHYRESDFHYDVATCVPATSLPDFHGYRIELTNLNSRIIDGHLQLTVSDALVSRPGFLPEPVPLKNGFVDGRIRTDIPGFALNRLELPVIIPAETNSDPPPSGIRPAAVHPGPTLLASGLILMEKAGVSLNLNAELDRITARQVLALWPKDLIPDVRSWITDHIPRSVSEKARMLVEIAPGDWRRAGGLPHMALEILMPFTDTEIRYCHPLPPLSSASGELRIYGDRAVIEMKEARCAGTRLEDGQAHIHWAGVKTAPPDTATLDVAARFTGPLQDLVQAEALLSGKDAARWRGMNGIASSSLQFACPLSVQSGHRLKLNSTVHDFIFPDAGVEKGEIHLLVENDELRASGTVAAGGIPVDIHWHRLNAADPLRIKTRFAVEDLFGGALPGNGTAALTGSIRALDPDNDPASGGAGDVHFSADVDITDVRINTLHMGAEKPAGVPGTVHLEGRALAGGGVRFNEIKLRTPEIRFSGTGSVLCAKTGDGCRRLETELQFSRIHCGKSRLSAVNIHSCGREGGSAEIVAQDLDLVPFLSAGITDLSPSEDKGSMADSPHAGGGCRHNLCAPPVDLRMRIDRLHLKNKAVLTGITGKLELRDGHLIKGLVRAEGTGNSERKTELKIVRGSSFDGKAEARSRLEITGETADVLAAGVGITTSMKGGSLRLILVFQKALCPDSHADISLSIKDFSMVRVPALAQIFSTISLVAIPEQLETGGIHFDRMEGKLVWHNRELTIHSGVMDGLSWRMTGKGKWLPRHNRISLRGAVVPFNLLNKLVGMIPVVGEFLIGDGIFAANYRMEGDLQSPEVKISPLSALSVGFLKQLFRDTGSPASAPAGPGRPWEDPEPSEGR